jgi:hypothetical protein
MAPPLDRERSVEISPAFILLDGIEDVVGIYLEGEDALEEMEPMDIVVAALAVLDDDGYLLCASPTAEIEMN